MDINALNRLPAGQAKAELLSCCGSRRWAGRMAAGRPYADAARLFEVATKTWNGLSREDWLEAFSRHPRIGDKKSLRVKFASTAAPSGHTGRPWAPSTTPAAWAGEEQGGVRVATERILDELAAGNREYERKFGHLFIVCATGKSAEEMLGLLRGRLGNDPEAELKVAATEQDKITKLRLERLLKP